MPMHNLIEYSENYSKTSENLWESYRVEANATLKNSESFKSKVKITGKALDTDNTKDVKTAVPLKRLCNFWRTLGMSLISSEINLILTCSAKCVSTNSANAKLYVLVVTWSTQDNAKLLRQLKSGFKRTINEEKNQSKKNKNGNSTFTSLWLWKNK